MPKKLSIRELPDPILKSSAEEVETIPSSELDTLIDDMTHTVLEHNGVGLSAPQIGVSKRIIIVASRPNARYPYAPGMPPIAMINPEIISHSSRQETDWEGCLSVPDKRGQVPRAKNIRVSYTDRYGKQIQEEYSGFLARIIQHEIDHLNGLNFTQRLEEKDKLFTEEEFLNLIANRS